jgi:hypothetical protein
MAANERISFKREYNKIPEILAAVSSLASTFLLVFAFIITPMNNFLFYSSIVKDSFFSLDPAMAAKQLKKKERPRLQLLK